MQHERQVAIIESLHRLLDAGATQMADDVTRIPVDTYTCEQRLRDERERLFRGHPLVLGLSHDLPAPGTFVTNDRAGVPVLMTRSEDGEVHAFLNVCRHRGAKVATAERGSVRKVLTCPYHGWAYGLDGGLRHIPNAPAFAGVDRDCHGLTRLPALERHGMIWVQLEPGRPLDVATSLGALDSEFESYDLGRYHFYEQRVIEQPFNWKIAIDTFLEPYHFGVLHRNSIAPIFLHDVCLVEQFGPHLREVLPRKSVEELRARPHAEWDLLPHSALVYVLFPNTVVVVQIDHIELWRIYPHPTDPAECHMTMDFLTPEPVDTDAAREHWRKNMELLMLTVMEEDFPTGATIQQGLTSGAQSHVTFGRNEPALALFELTVAAQAAGRAA